MGETGCFEFWPLYLVIDVMWVYIVGADSRVLSHLGGLFFLEFCCGLGGHVLIFCSLLVAF
jgi:hypothetical protein